MQHACCTYEINLHHTCGIHTAYTHTTYAQRSCGHIWADVYDRWQHAYSRHAPYKQHVRIAHATYVHHPCNIQASVYLSITSYSGLARRLQCARSEVSLALQELKCAVAVQYFSSDRSELRHDFSRSRLGAIVAAPGMQHTRSINATYMQHTCSTHAAHMQHTCNVLVS